MLLFNWSYNKLIVCFDKQTIRRNFDEKLATVAIFKIIQLIYKYKVNVSMSR